MFEQTTVQRALDDYRKRPRVCWLIIEDLAYDRRIIRLLPSSLSRQLARPATHRKTEEERQLAEGRWGERTGRAKIIRQKAWSSINHSKLSATVWPMPSATIHVSESEHTIQIRMDAHWFGSLDSDPYPHWGKNLEKDPHWNQCGSKTPVGPVHNRPYFDKVGLRAKKYTLNKSNWNIEAAAFLNLRWLDYIFSLIYTNK